ncbi:MAG: 4Fe-4S binding protein [Gammaproteobacteria bacterium]|nr:4Fe-4S binding protein [Gammaproteobacteria bacterium]MCP5136629.1 4Fe-4S binding protein [Gammaproteobacteria bacterium]
MPDNSRRAFLRGAFLDPEARAAERRRLKPLGPPPPWIGEQVETQACRQCAAPCVDVCPQAIVKRHAPDHVLAGIPWLDFSDAGCTFCGQCADACPAGVTRTDTPPEIGKVALDTSRCHAWNGVICMSCLRYCEVGALHRAEQLRVRLETAACTGCGACIAPCPAEALSFNFQT